jgi:hypothetical protein
VCRGSGYCRTAAIWKFSALTTRSRSDRDQPVDATEHWCRTGRE